MQITAKSDEGFMNIYTIGFTKRTAKQFFTPIKEQGIQLLIDIRLNNASQLAGFSKGKDIDYFLKEICGCDYDHNSLLAPAKEILDAYKKNLIDWNQYEERFVPLIEKRGVIPSFAEKYTHYDKVCLLCSEPEPSHCHRRLIAEMLLRENPSWTLEHI
jgi:uncharacterized protein (DUF488 family)